MRTPKGGIMTSLVQVLAVSVLWQAAASAQVAASGQDSNCWLRDGVSPAKSLVYLLCEQGGLMVTTDAGTTWSSRSTGAKTWEPRKTGATENLTSIQFIGQSGWVTGYDGVILHTADGGGTWAPQTTGTKESFENVFFLDAERGWVVGWDGMIVRTTNGGRTWQQVRSDAAAWSLTSVFFRDASNGWIVGFSGQILRSRDGGVTWMAQTSPVRSSLSSILFDSSNRGWVTADETLLG